MRAIIEGSFILAKYTLDGTADGDEYTEELWEVPGIYPHDLTIADAIRMYDLGWRCYHRGYYYPGDRVEDEDFYSDF